MLIQFLLKRSLNDLVNMENVGINFTEKNVEETYIGGKC
jgi:hypothetical protein